MSERELTAEYLRGAIFGVRMLAWLATVALEADIDPIVAVAVSQKRALEALRNRQQMETLSERVDVVA